MATRSTHHGGGARAGEASLDLDAFKVLLVLELLLDVLVPLQQLIVLNFALLEPLVHPRLDLLPKRVHLVGLFLNQCCLGRDDLLVALLHVPVALLVLHLLRLDLHLVGLGVLLLPRQLALDGLQVEQLSRELEGERQLLLEHLAVVLQVADVALLEGADRLLVLLLDLREGLIPALVEVLVLHQVRLLDLLPLAGLVVHQLLSAAIVILNL